jgi:formylglycine-generating enzyme required for sulfatase activity
VVLQCRRHLFHSSRWSKTIWRSSRDSPDCFAPAASSQSLIDPPRSSSRRRKKLYHVYNFVGIRPKQQFVSSELEPGKYTLGMEFVRAGKYGESVGKAKLYVDDKKEPDPALRKGIAMSDQQLENGAAVAGDRRAAPGIAPRPDMVWIPGGTFRMGSNKHYPEERPVHRVTVDGFWMDRYPVTNERFAKFVAETGHQTFAEIPPNAADYPGALSEMLYAGSLVFVKPSGPVDTRDFTNWWQYVRDAWWRCPEGAASSIDAREQHPVVHVTSGDAEAFARWDGKEIPTEAEWEFAARGGLDGKAYAWGDTFLPNDIHLANTWQGQFPWQSLAKDGYEGTSPVGAFPPNGYGLFDMIGNVWEWTTDWYQPRHPADAVKACCIPLNPRGPRVEGSYDPCQPQINIPRKVLKGGSHLCAPNYCRRYRPAARYPEPVDTSTCHIGFRCIVRPASGGL